MKKVSKSKKDCNHELLAPVYKNNDKELRWYWHCMECGAYKVMKDDWRKPEDFFFINHRG